MIMSSGGDSESTRMLEQIPIASLDELSARTYSVPHGQGVVLIASSNSSGDQDIISSTGDPFNPSNQVIPTTNGYTSFVLFRQDSPTIATVVSNVITTTTPQSLSCSTSSITPGLLRLDFSGVLQFSSDLLNWSDVVLNPTSPYFFTVGSNQKGFFRARN